MFYIFKSRHISWQICSEENILVHKQIHSPSHAHILSDLDLSECQLPSTTVTLHCILMVLGRRKHGRFMDSQNPWRIFHLDYVVHFNWKPPFSCTWPTLALRPRASSGTNDDKHTMMMFTIIVFLQITECYHLIFR